MYSVFNKVLQSDMGKTMVRKNAPTFDAQSVWRGFESHMSTSSKGLNERCRLHAYETGDLESCTSTQGG